MAPKAKKKKKTKEELEAERLAAEEAARLAEEERLRLEEQERQRLAELERQRVELLSVLLTQEEERVTAEREELSLMTSQHKLERAHAAARRKEAQDWDRFLACVHVPSPLDPVAVDSYMRRVREALEVALPDTLKACQDCYTMVDEAALLALTALLEGDLDAVSAYAKEVATLQELVMSRIDSATAHMLQHSDEHANEKGEVQLGLHMGSFQWGLWVNTSKNPRLKTVEMPALHLVVDIPKQIALASVAMRVLVTDKDEYFTRCRNEYMAVGGVTYVDLLALPPGAKHVRQWVLRQVTPLAHSVTRVPYPIPPAGADPATYRSEDEPPPLGFAFPMRQDLAMLDGPKLMVGWWSNEVNAWSTEGVSDVTVSGGVLSFDTTHLGALALIQSRARLLPYNFWSVRPTGGLNGKTVAVTLQCENLAQPIVFEVGPGYASLAAPTDIPALAPLLGVQLPPEQLLLSLSSKGMHLLPEDRDAMVCGMKVKDPEVEKAMCADLALVAGSCLLARSRWNQAGAGAGECIARLSEVTDWEAGGRTEMRHVERVFGKEKEDGERRVLAVIQRGRRGVAFIDALDKREQYPALPGHESVASVQACLDTVWGEVHASVVTLLKGVTPKAGNQASTSAGGTATSEGGQGANNESLLTLRLCLSPEGIDLVRTTDALLTQSLAQLLTLLRVFSFS